MTNLSSVPAAQKISELKTYLIERLICAVEGKDIDVKRPDYVMVRKYPTYKTGGELDIKGIYENIDSWIKLISESFDMLERQIIADIEPPYLLNGSLLKGGEDGKCDCDWRNDPKRTVIPGTHCPVHLCKICTLRHEDDPKIGMRGYCCGRFLTDKYLCSGCNLSVCFCTCEHCQPSPAVEPKSNTQILNDTMEEAWKPSPLESGQAEWEQKLHKWWYSEERTYEQAVHFIKQELARQAEDLEIEHQQELVKTVKEELASQREEIRGIERNTLKSDNKLINISYVLSGELDRMLNYLDHKDKK